MAAQGNNDADGCAGCLGFLAVAFVIALIIGAVISIAALVDPFSWLPSVTEVWEDPDSDGDYGFEEAAFKERYPDFGWRVVANVAWTLVAAIALIGFGAAVADFREQQRKRYESEQAAAEYRKRRGALAGAACAVAAMAALPLLIAVF